MVLQHCEPSHILFFCFGRARLHRSHLPARTHTLTRRNCSLADADYAPILEQLAPFRAAGGITPELVARTWARLNQPNAFLSLVEVRGGRAREVQRVSPGNRDTGSAFLLERVLPALAPRLPDMRLVLNLHDTPAAWTAPLPPDTEAALANGSLALGAALAAHGCDAVSSELAEARRQGLHGFFQAENRGYYWAGFNPYERGLMPVLSWTTVPGCFAGAAGS